jgi:hypothetical protein
MKMIKSLRKKLKKTPDGKNPHVAGLSGLIVCKWLYYSKSSTDSMQFP